MVKVRDVRTFCKDTSPLPPSPLLTLYNLVSLVGYKEIRLACVYVDCGLLYVPAAVFSKPSGVGQTGEAKTDLIRV